MRFFMISIKLFAALTAAAPPAGPAPSRPTPTDGLDSLRAKFGTAHGGALDLPEPTTPPMKLANGKEAGPELFTLIVAVFHTVPVTTFRVEGKGSPTPVQGQASAGVMATAAAATVVVPRGYKGNIAFNNEGYSATTGDESLIEFSSQQQNGIWTPDVDVSYVDGFSVPISCLCGGYEGGPEPRICYVFTLQAFQERHSRVSSIEFDCREHPPPRHYEIFRKLNVHKKESFVKLAFHLLMLFTYLYIGLASATNYRRPSFGGSCAYFSSPQDPALSSILRATGHYHARKAERQQNTTAAIARRGTMNCNELQEGARGERYIVKRPKALQWFCDGQLHKDTEEERQAGRFELFLDLLYVAIVANLSDELSEHPDGVHVAKYILTFTPAWHIWVDLREIMNSYYTDDLMQRLTILWVMALLVLFANNANFVDEDIGAMRTAAGAYVAARFTTMLFFLISSFASYAHQMQARIMATFMFVGLLITIPLFFESVSNAGKAGVVAVMIVYQEFTWSLTLSPWLKKRLKLRYSTAVDIAHEIDRMAAFFIIILGEFVYIVIVGNPAGIGLTPGYGKAVCTLIISFCLNWIYVSGDGSLEATHPIRRSAWTAFGFFLLHLPMSAAFLIAGHVSAFSVRVEEFEEGQRWLLGAGLGVGIFCLWVYGMLYQAVESHKLMLPKNLRVGMRLVVAVILMIIPVTHEHFNATQFMVLVMGLVAFLVIWETIGGLLKGATIFEPWTDDHPPPGASLRGQNSTQSSGA